MTNIVKPKIIVILGQTAVGKSDLAVFLAKKFNGEVVSADSRQVYTGLNIGSGKITKKEMQGIPHHLLDVCNPRKVFTVSDFKKLAEKSIAEILDRKKVPIICGGTGFYIDSIIKNLDIPEVPPNKELRKKLERLSTEKLFGMLLKLDKNRAKNIDKKNKVRLIRAIEICKALGKVPKIAKSLSLYDSLQIGLKTDDQKLKEKIEKRIIKRLKIGMIKEAENLHKNGLSYKRMRELGLEYRCLADLLENKINKDEFIEILKKESFNYAKRQQTWFKRDKNIKWFDPENIQEVEKEVEMFLK